MTDYLTIPETRDTHRHTHTHNVLFVTAFFLGKVCFYVKVMPGIYIYLQKEKGKIHAGKGPCPCFKE